MFLLKNRWLAFAAISTVLLLVNFVATGTPLPSSSTSGLWFYSGIFLLLFAVFFVEPYFSGPQTTLANTTPALLVLLTTVQDFRDLWVWASVLVFMIILSIAAVVSMSMPNPQSSKGRWLAAFALSLTKSFGRARVSLSVFFFVLLLETESKLFDNTGPLLLLLIVWATIVAIDVSKLSKSFRRLGDGRRSAVANIDRHESENLAVARVVSGTRMPSVGSPLVLSSGAKAIVVGVTALAAGNELRLLIEPSGGAAVSQSTPTQVFLDPDSAADTSVIGLVDAGSEVHDLHIRIIEHSSARVSVGDTVVVSDSGTSVFYQVLNIDVRDGSLASRDSEGFRNAFANQLGVWDDARSGFSNFGRVPVMNSRVSTQVAIATFTSRPDQFHLGSVPGTGLPAQMDLRGSIDHHVAVIGATGAGKSHLALRLVTELEADFKIVCVDFTGEWAKKRPGFFPIQGTSDIATFLASDKPFALIEIASMTNTIGTINKLASAMESLLQQAKSAFTADTPLRICLVLEEAHTIVPEQNFLGVNDFDAKAAVNKISQIALQGRKYGIGLLVLAQRTANVSKTVLTQCSTVIAFRVFDDTSIGFLSNYVGSSVASSLPQLPDRHAIVSGKGSLSARPVIVDLN